MEEILQKLKKLNPKLSFAYPYEFKKLDISAIEIRGTGGDLTKSVKLPIGAKFIEGAECCSFSIGSDLNDSKRIINLIPML